MKKKKIDPYQWLADSLRRQRLLFKRIILEPIEEALIIIAHRDAMTVRGWMKISGTRSLAELAQWIQTAAETELLSADIMQIPPNTADSSSSSEEEGIDETKGEENQ